MNREDSSAVRFFPAAGPIRRRIAASEERESMELDENLKGLVKQLGASINESLSASEPVAEALENIREAGYDVFLILEATIGLQKNEPESNHTQKSSSLSSGELFLTAQDAQFLKSLKICLGGAEGHPSSAS